MLFPVLALVQLEPQVHELGLRETERTGEGRGARWLFGGAWVLQVGPPLRASPGSSIWRCARQNCTRPASREEETRFVRRLNAIFGPVRLRKQQLVRHLAAVVLGILVVFPGTACRRDEPPPGVVCFVFDAAAASHFGAYGYGRETSPNFDRLASRSLLFQEHFAPAPYTFSSFASFFTSAYPPFHGAIRLGDRLPDNLPVLAELLRAKGIRTGAFVANAWLEASFGFSRGFDEYRNYQAGSFDPDRERATDYEALLRDVGRFLSSVRGDRFFLLVHVLLPHNPYAPPPQFLEPFGDPSYRGSFTATTRALLDVDAGTRTLEPEDRRRLVDLYDGNLRYGDWILGRTLEALRAAGRWKNSALIVTSDHGEAFGQHGRYLHNSTVYDEMIRVPLLLRLPHARASAPDTAALGDHVDLLPTILQLFDLPVPEHGLQGISLLIPDRAARKPFVLSFSTELSLVALRSDRFKFIRAREGKAEYY
ncbi:MAG TPA: sulfatase, partial [Thermoanaerobaculia bacterium]|nr:sulfatase [Thermoanaerobaculia bacterium]